MTVLRLDREMWLWRGFGAAVLFGVLAWRTGVFGPKVVQAQPPAGARMEYRQAEVTYRRTAEAIGEWEARGWETYQVIPVYPANPGTGGAMTVAIIFRRPAK